MSAPTSPPSNATAPTAAPPPTAPSPPAPVAPAPTPPVTPSPPPKAPPPAASPPPPSAATPPAPAVATPPPASPATPAPPPSTTPDSPAAPPPPVNTPGTPPSPPSPSSNPTPSHPSPSKPNSPPSPPSSSSPSSGSSLSTGVVVGVAAGGIVVLLLLSLICVCCWKKKKRRGRDDIPMHYSMPPPPPPPGMYKDEQYARPYQQWQQPSDHVYKPSSDPTPPPPYGSRPPQAPPTPPPPPPPGQVNSSGSGSNYSGGEHLPPPSPGIAFGMSKSTFTYEELVIATNGFSDENLLGQGGFGYVHKGVLPTGKEIAVKQLKTGSGQGEREFQAEVEIISRVHHKHLVSLVGYCISGGQRLLVYEFVPNNTLEYHLHAGRGRPTMEWSIRLKIALGSAKGLAYLHEDCHPKIIHRDIKASNILLDHKFEAKVADFGLAKFTEDNNTHVSTRQNLTPALYSLGRAKMSEVEEVEMESVGDDDAEVDLEAEEEEEEEVSPVVPFQLQFDKPVPFQVKMAEWNPEKDLLAIVTDESKVLLHRFNWQRLWTVIPGKSITSLCWSPDGKVIALGTEDGSIFLHDVENGKMLRSMKTHDVAVVCLNWEEDTLKVVDRDNHFAYEDRTARFFPPPPRVPRMPGLSDGDLEETTQELSSVSCQRFNILCSSDRDGNICFSIFGIFPIGRINIHNILLPDSSGIDQYQLKNASISKVGLSKDLCRLEALCSGELLVSGTKTSNSDTLVSLHCLNLDTSIFLKRKSELHQVAQQASNIEDLVEVIRASISVMSKQWGDAMNLFNSKVKALAALITDHGSYSNPQDEFLSLLLGFRTSSALQQFLLSSLGEAGLKRLAKTVDNAGKELRTVVNEHLQPALELIGFRVGELRGLSRWRARFKGVGLDEKLMDNLTESAGMLLVQAERFSRVLTIVLFLFQNFFNWLLKCTKILLQEPIDQVQQANSELVVVFLKCFFQSDPVEQLLNANGSVEVDIDTMKRIEQLIAFGGYKDRTFLDRTLASECNKLEKCLKEAFLMPFTTVSETVTCKRLAPLFPIPTPAQSTSPSIPMSIIYYKEEIDGASEVDKVSTSLTDYTCFKVLDGSLGLKNCIGIVRGFMTGLNTYMDREELCLDAVLVNLPDHYECVDLSMYKENQIVLLLNESDSNSDTSERSLMVMIQASDLPFISVPRCMPDNIFFLHQLEDSMMSLDLDIGKFRAIPHNVTTPLAVSASRGLACVFSSNRHALVYILDEDEDEISEME